MKSAEEFIKRLKTDEAFQKRLVESKNREEFMKKIGEEYRFTQEELKAVMNREMPEAELDDRELDMVAGGKLSDFNWGNLGLGAVKGAATGAIGGAVTGSGMAFVGAVPGAIVGGAFGVVGGAATYIAVEAFDSLFNWKW